MRPGTNLPDLPPPLQIDQLRAELLQERSSRQDLECDKISLERQVWLCHTAAPGLLVLGLGGRSLPPACAEALPTSFLVFFFSPHPPAKGSTLGGRAGVVNLNGAKCRVLQGMTLPALGK